GRGGGRRGGGGAARGAGGGRTVSVDPFGDGIPFGLEGDVPSLVLPPPSAPMEVAREFVRHQFTDPAGALTLHHWRGGWWQWETDTRGRDRRDQRPRREGGQARDDQEARGPARDGARLREGRAEPGPGQADQAPQGAQAARPAAARRARRTGGRTDAPASRPAAADHRRVRPPGERAG